MPFDEQCLDTTLAAHAEAGMRVGRCTTVNEAALRAELAEVMLTFRADFEGNRLRVQSVERYLLEGLERVQESTSGYLESSMVVHPALGQGRA